MEDDSYFVQSCGIDGLCGTQDDYFEIIVDNKGRRRGKKVMNAYDPEAAMKELIERKQGIDERMLKKLEEEVEKYKALQGAE